MKIFRIANSYVKKMNVMDLALIKFCLFFGGLAIGMKIPKKSDTLFKSSILIFLISYCALMTKFVSILALRNNQPRS